MSSDLNGSAGSRPSRVVRSATEWSTIMADFERSGLSRRAFCETRGLSVKTFGNWRHGPGASASGRQGPGHNPETVPPLPVGAIEPHPPGPEAPVVLFPPSRALPPMSDEKRLPGKEGGKRWVKFGRLLTSHALCVLPSAPRISEFGVIPAPVQRQFSMSSMHRSITTGPDREPLTIVCASIGNLSSMSASTTCNAALLKSFASLADRSQMRIERSAASALRKIRRISEGP